MSFSNTIKRIPILNRIILFFFRLKILLKFQYNNCKIGLKWFVKSRETTNYTYDLENLNKVYLIQFIADITNKKFDEIAKYIKEIENDKYLKKHIIYYTKKHKDRLFADKIPKYSRRIGWYAIIRAIKPKVIIETGVDKGLGACITCAALLKNKKEGKVGHYYGTEIDTSKGYLLQKPYTTVGEILFGDSVKSLKKFNKKIDLFINDSDHSANYEAQEYETIKNKLNKNGIILGDNSLHTDKLFKFSLANKRKFRIFQEKPKDHIYLGESIGVSFEK
jgi:predicted O-methyltransferase YrrM